MVTDHVVCPSLGQNIGFRIFDLFIATPTDKYGPDLVCADLVQVAALSYEIDFLLKYTTCITVTFWHCNIVTVIHKLTGRNTGSDRN